MLEGRVLVTGANGFIGRHVVNALVGRGVEVHGVARSISRDVRCDIFWHGANLLDSRERTELLNSVTPQTIIHCAWVTEHNIYWTSPENLDWVAATLSLAREARELGTSRLVGVGTCAEYAWDTGEALSELTTPLHPATLYGVAKDATRRILDSYSRISGLSCAWARVALLYGAGEHKDRFVASLARAFVQGEPAKMSSGKRVRDFLDVRDVGAAIVEVAASSLSGGVNIGSGQPVSLLHIGEMLARIAKRQDLLRAGAVPDREGEPAEIVMDVARLMGETNFHPRIVIDQGLEDALAYWRAAFTP